MFAPSIFLSSMLRLYNHSTKIPSQFPSKCLSSMCYCCLHHLTSSSPAHKSIYVVTGTRFLGLNTRTPVVNGYSSYSQCNHRSVLWYSSKSTRHLFRAYRKRVNRRLRLANKPVLDEAQFNKAISQLPARFAADDLYNVIALEGDPLVCLELFNWASRQPRFKHSLNTYHITIKKLGDVGMIEQMDHVVNQVLAVPNFGSEALCNTIIYFFTEARKLSRAVTVFKHMKKVKNPDCRPSIRTYNLLFAAFLSRGKDTYINHVFMETMECLFKQMLNDGIEPDLFSINSMINGYVLSNHVNDALRLFHQMGVVYRCLPNAVTYDHLIHGLCAQGRTNNARELFSQMKEKGFVSSARTYNSLVNALALGGEVEEAVKYLWEMSAKQRPADFITYKTLLDEFCRKGQAAEALSLLKEFQEKCLVDGPTFRKLLHIFEDVFANSRRKGVAHY